MKVGIRFFNGDTDWAWIQEVNPILRVEDTGGMVAFNEETDELIGACIWDHWTINGVQCHIFSVNSLEINKSNLIFEVFDYIFNVRKRSLIYSFICADNKKAFKRIKTMGFTEDYRLKQGWDDDTDLVLVSLRKENCNYLPNNGVIYD